MKLIKYFFLLLFNDRQSKIIKYLSVLSTTFKYLIGISKISLKYGILLFPKIIKSQIFMEFKSTFNKSRLNKIAYFEKKYQFNYPDWFGGKILVWEKIIKELNDQKIDYLEIGSFEGRSAVFVSELKNINSIMCVDTFEGGDEHSSVDFKEVFNNLKNNLKKTPNQNYKIFKGKSNNFFVKNSKKFNLIYIDGSHFYEDVKLDFENSLNYLKKGGVLICDDFLWFFYKDILNNPLRAILECYEKNKNNLEIIFVNYQIIFKKNK